MYQNLSCRQLAGEAERVRAALPAAERSVQKTYSDDKALEAVTWILFWPAAFAMDGNDAEAAQLARLKGEADGIRSAMLSKGC